MKTRIGHAESQLIDRIVDLARNVPRTSQKRNAKYSNVLEFALIELIKTRMRSLALAGDHIGRRTEILTAAINLTVKQLYSAFESNRLEIDLEPYLKQARKELKASAGELQRLSQSLANSRGAGKLPALIMQGDAEENRFEIRSLGLADQISGILALPRADAGEIDVERLLRLRDATLAGEWFPYELHWEEFVFVIDDDGSVFVSVENLPTSLAEKAERLVETVMRTLYG